MSAKSDLLALKPWPLLRAFLCSALASAGILVLPKIVQTVIDSLRSGISARGLLEWLCLFLIVSFLSVTFKYFSTISFFGLAKQMAKDMRQKLIANILSGAEISGRFTALTQDIVSITHFVENGLSRISATFWLYGLGVFFLASLNPCYIPAVFAGVAGSLWIWAKGFSRLGKLYRLERDRYGKYQKSLSQWIQDLERVKGRALEVSTTKQFSKANRDQLNVLLAAHSFSLAMMPAILILWGLIAVLFILIGAHGFRAGRLSCGEFAASLQYLAFFSMPTLDLCYAGDLWRKARVAWRQLSFFSEARNAKVDEAVYLSRQPYFFSRPLIENFRLMDPVPSLEEIEKALRSASLADENSSASSWLERDPNTFSSGERKRAALARLFLRQDAPVWILDEPTEGLNPEIAEKILTELSRFKEEKTIIIRHRENHVPTHP